MAVRFIRSDLEFILAQIRIAERQAAGENLLDILPNVEVPFGLRTIDGSFNNLVLNQSLFGAADTVFPRLTDPVFRTADPIPAGFPGAGTPTSYAQTSGFVFDAQPRIISNLLVDQTPNNPAVVAAAAQTPGSKIVTSPGLDGQFGTADDTSTFFIPNVTADAGLTAPFNQWMTFFGQFFDHGLDLVTKGGSGTVFIPLQPDDPLFVPGSPTNFMVLTRATNLPGPDGILGTADDIHESSNTTSPFVDQNQTYSSHPSHQVFLRAYEFRDSDPGPAVHLAPVATGKLIVNRNLGADGHFGTADDTVIGGMATWAVVKAQARDILGINLTDADFDNVPLLATDPYGNFIKGPNGFPQVVMKGPDGLAGTADDFLMEGNPAAPISLLNAARTGHQFLIDIAHSAVPVSSTGTALLPDADTVAGGPVAAGFYDNELLDAHYIAGDGRVNENIGLTTVHSIFHSEHNRLVEHTKSTLLSDAAQMLAGGATQAAAVAFLNEWLVVDVASVPTPAQVATLQWDGERLFQAAKFGTEMQYQHLVFEEFARTIQPQVDAFLAPNGYDTTVNPAIVAEFAHTVFRFGHSMLLETVDRFDPNFNVVGDGNPTLAGNQQTGLIAAFLNPLAFAASGPTPEQAAGAIVRGITRQVGNEIDEFVTDALRNNLVGLPLDLPVLNLARGRDTGIPSLNEARREFYAMTGDSQLTPYTSWADLVQHIKHPESLINFIAAYGTHASITSATTLADKRAAATDLVLGGPTAPADRLDFLNSTGAWANVTLPGKDGVLGTADDLKGVTTTGVDAIDFWIGGLAEEKMPFGGMLGSTFNFVFENQLENLQNGDRFYYLSRTAGLNFGTELEQNSFAKLVMLNTDATHLPAHIFQTPAFILEVDQTHQFNASVVAGPDGIVGTADDLPASADPFGPTIHPIGSARTDFLTPQVIRDNPATPGPDTNYLHYTGAETVVLGGTPGNDILLAGDSDDDTIWGDAGNDRLDGGYGNDTIDGGPGDDIITDAGGGDTIDGGDGNDVIHGGNSTVAVANVLRGGNGQDFIITTEDISLIFGGQGNDFILGAKVNGQEMGNEGDDWIEKGTQDGAPGDNFSPFAQDEVIGNDIFLGGGGFDEMIGEGGDDIFVGSGAQDKMDGMSGFDWTTYKDDRFGVTVDMSLAIFAPAHGAPGALGGAPPVGASPNSILDRFFFVEGLSGSAFSDILRGDDADAATLLLAGAKGSVLTNLDLISGLRAFLGTAAAGPDGIVGTADDQFGAGNIILGGAGSDIIEGRRGDDLIDGDKWLNVRISVRAGIDPVTGLATGPEIASFDSMEPLIPFMLNGTYNPGQLVAVREILDPVGAGGFDTANFSGNRADYTIAVNGIVVNPVGPLNIGANDVVTVTDSVAGRDGTDRLTHMERLQFADQSQVLVSGLNAEPVGQLAILDAATSTPDTTPTSGQLLRVSIAGVTDADNPTGAITGAVSYVWQAEVAPGVFQDILLLPGRISIGIASADGTTLKVTPDLVGQALRVKAIYEDAHGVTEQAFSAPTAPVAAGVAAPATRVTPLPDGSNVSSAGVHYIQSDLQFILDQIVIAEKHAAGEDILSLLPNVRMAVGLRTVDGSFNNLTPGQSEFGAADTVFPRVTTPNFRTADPIPAGFPGAGTPTSYAQTSGFVFDSQPRTISNLLVDQTANNPAAYATAFDPGVDGVLHTADDVLKDGVQIVKSPGLDGAFGTADDKDVFFFPNVSPDAGLTAPFNQWMTFFGQFFDHGLDLVTKGGSGTVFIPLQPDDPLFVPGSPTNFMVLTRATNLPGPDGILGTADDIHENTNTTSPFVDQNQTYSSHPSHQVFLRAYEFRDSDPGPAVHLAPVATGSLIVNRDLGADGRFGTADDVVKGGMATWAVVKAQARDILGINLTDADFDNVPLLATDPYGNFIKGPNGFPQVVMKGPDGIAGTADDVLVEGNPLAPISLVNAARTGHAFLNDIAHTAVPVDGQTGAALLPDADSVIGGTPAPGFYDNELLDAHYIAGDGRVNENIGLTSVHQIFHSEHNRLVEHTKAVVLASAAATATAPTGDVSFLNQWLLTPVTTVPADLSTLDWNGERLFQAAKFGTEMQYQHLVFEEFARTIQPMIDPFFAPTQVYDTDLNPAIVAEFAHTVYRFGHSMLLETVDRFDPNFNVVGDGNPTLAGNQQTGLIAAFLNPLAFAASGPTPEQAAGAIIRGVTRQVGNEIDEFVTDALRNNLLGLPLDLATINLARGRDTGIPSLNAARREIHNQTGDSELTPYTSWADLVQHLKHPESLVNFIAAYGTHASITSATTLADKRAAAVDLVFGSATAPADRLDFLNSTGAWASDPVTGVTTTGLDNVDLWIGGLAEEKMPFGGMLGSTFNFVFENQLEKLQDGDRFYYLERTAGLNFGTELEGNSFAKLIMANTDATHLSGHVFLTPAFTLEVDQTRQFNASVVAGPDGIVGTADDLPASADPVGPSIHPIGSARTDFLTPQVIRDNPDTVGPDTHYLHYTGAETVVLGGTPFDDILIAGDSDDDTVWGDGGNDRIDGGYGNDLLRGGAGDDIITDKGGDDNIQGGDGNDVIHGGNGANLILGGLGKDFIVTGEDASVAEAGPGNDFILGSKPNDFSFGNEGDDWIEGGSADGVAGDNFDPFGNDPVNGNDVFLGDGGPDNMDGEGGDDIMIGTASEADRFIGFSGFDWATFKNDPVGVTIGLDSKLRFLDQPPVPGSSASIISRLDLVEGLSGSAHADVLTGDDANAATIVAAGATGSVLTNLDLIAGLRAFLGTAAAGPDGIVGTADDQFGSGNIILGGAGGDILEGRGGDDLIDGDRWLNVRISVRANTDGTGAEIASFDSMVPLVPFMLNGTYNPGQLQIVREILTAPSPDFDTAVFTGNLADYTFKVNGIDIVGAPLNIVPGDIVTVTDSVAARDGSDRLTNIERLQFADQSVVLSGLNAAPVGALMLSDSTPAVGQVLTVSSATVSDPDNTATSGVITGGMSYFWQAELVVGTGIFSDIIRINEGGQSVRAEGTTFTVTPDLDGLALRVMAVYKDQNNTLETVFSAPTAAVHVNAAPVITSDGGLAAASVSMPENTTAVTIVTATDVNAGDVITFSIVGGLDALKFSIDPATGALSFITPPDFENPTDAGGNNVYDVTVQASDGLLTDTQNIAVTVTNANDAPTGTPVIIASTNGTALLTASTAGIADQDGIATPLALQWQRSADGGTTWTDVAGATSASFSVPTTAASDQLLRVQVSYTDGLGNPTVINSAPEGLIVGTNASDALTGTAFSDLMLGLGGNDTLNGGLGADTLVGGIGNDTYVVDNAGDVVIENPGEGIDEVQTASFAAYVLGANVENLTHTGSNTFVGIGNALNNVITGGTGNDYLIGFDGNDTLIDGSGLNTLQGGTGDDIYVVQSNADTVFEFANEGTDQVQTSLASYTLSNNVENLTFIGAVTHTGFGNALANVLTGNGGNDTLDGGLGADTLVGGAGNDIYIVDNVGDVAVENLNEGTDTVQTSLSAYMLGANVENLTHTGSNDFVGIGNGLSNVIIGGTGNDYLIGFAGNDTLIDGSGLNTLQGGLGDDIYAVQSNDDTVFEFANEGTDQVQTFLPFYHLSPNVENLTFIGTTSHTGLGNELANVLTGGGGNDTLDGGLGADRLIGGAGNDTYIVDNVGDIVVENFNEGTDAVQTASLSAYILGANVENLTHTGSNDFVGIGNGLSNWLIGGTGNDYLIGFGGNDVLIDGGGLNTLQGGTGDDIYAVQSTTDTVFEFANEGTDQVQTFLNSYTLSNNVENLTFVGAVSHNGTGNASNNVLTGNSGNDTLSGGAGNDTIIGGAGDDVMNGGADNDTFIFNAGFGHDVITQFGDAGTDQDLIDFSAGVFANFAAVQAASHQVGADVHIDVTASDTIVLTNTVLGNLAVDDFRFH